LFSAFLEADIDVGLAYFIHQDSAIRGSSLCHHQIAEEKVAGAVCDTQKAPKYRYGR